MGPGLIESIYERCLIRELELRQITVVCQRLVRIQYKGLVFEESLRCDVLIEGCLLLELKCVQEILAIHKAHILSYMKHPWSPACQGLRCSFSEPCCHDFVGGPGWKRWPTRQ
jgi:GxxExxY protein